MILFFYIVSLDFNIIGPFLNYQYSFPEVSVSYDVKMFIYGRPNFFIPRVEDMEIWGC